MKQITLIFATLMLLTACHTKKRAVEQDYQRMMVGAYTEMRQLEQEDVDLFQLVDKMYGPLDLTPVTVATQVVAGTNYIFRCTGNRGKEFDVKVFQPLPGEGGPIITEIRQLGVKTTTKNIVIVFYDGTIGPNHLERTLQQEGCEIIYRYANFNAFAIKMKSEKTRRIIEETRGVLQVIDNQVIHLDVNE